VARACPARVDGAQARASELAGPRRCEQITLAAACVCKSTTTGRSSFPYPGCRFASRSDRVTPFDPGAAGCRPTRKRLVALLHRPEDATAWRCFRSRCASSCLAIAVAGAVEVRPDRQPARRRSVLPLPPVVPLAGELGHRRLGKRTSGLYRGTCIGDKGAVKPWEWGVRIGGTSSPGRRRRELRIPRVAGVRPAATRCSSRPKAGLRGVNDQSFSRRIDRQRFYRSCAFPADRHSTAPGRGQR